MTEEGRTVAESTLERNRKIREFLVRIGVDEDTAIYDACEMEHAISPANLKTLNDHVKLIPQST